MYALFVAIGYAFPPLNINISRDFLDNVLIYFADKCSKKRDDIFKNAVIAFNDIFVPAFG